jgi:hypothetical protein
MMWIVILPGLFLLGLVVLAVLKAKGYLQAGLQETDAPIREIRRELAELRAEMVRSLRAIQIGLDELSHDDVLHALSGITERLERLTAIHQPVLSQGRGEKGAQEKRSALLAAMEPSGQRELSGSHAAGDERAGSGMPGDKRQLSLFHETSGKRSGELPETEPEEEVVEYIRVPGASFDPDLDPPFDPDAATPHADGSR